MRTNETMHKCPVCDTPMNKLTYLLATSKCPVCDAPIIYYDTFKIDKGDTIGFGGNEITLSSDIEAKIAAVVNDAMSEEFERSYRDGYSRGYEEGDADGYANGYKKARTDDPNEEYIKGFNSDYRLRRFFCERGDINGRSNDKYNGK